MAVASAQQAYQLSQRRACRALGAVRSSVQYIAARPPQTALRTRIREIAEVRVGYGYRRIQVRLRREGWQVNHKRTYGLYREDGLSLRMKPPSVDAELCRAHRIAFPLAPLASRRESVGRRRT